MRLGLLLPILVLAACSTPGSQVVDGPGLAGTYVVNGVDPLGVEYSGTVVIEPASEPDEFVVEWLVTGAIQRGIGVLDGDRFTVEWETIEGPRGDSVGVGAYVVSDEGVLTGTRTVAGLEGEGTEEIFPRP